ncbi:YppE family protein [Alteribacter natronophilus]|uniref:YppE family protein n=1 Tax=Alteribacter natronophilus TaxID=2583810 RepID=UPI00110F5B4A|nr:YppE family protein [Alteribacter natronophilus]TMW73551.1 DUF1798 family protein [Alteribacter natronophilus]
MNNQRLLELTKQLLELNREGYTYFERFAREKETADFEQYVKPFADRVKQAGDEWYPLASDYITSHKPRYIHDKQINAVHENINITAVTCFQADTKKKRYIEMNKSIHYTLEALREDLEA